jgi:uncharacterized protein (TIGR02118 family)
VIKLVYCVRKRDDVSPEEFHRYWLEDHGALVASVAEEIHAARYVQSHTAHPELNQILRDSRGLDEAYDGITEVWWESLAELQAALETEAGQEAQGRLIEDESTFIDFARSRVFLTEEHVIF